MAKKVVGPDGQPAEPKIIPSFTQIVNDDVQQRAANRDAVSGGDAPPLDDSALNINAGAKPQAGKPAEGDSTAFDFDTEWGKLPDNLRNGFVERFSESYGNAIKEQYGDLMPLLAECQKNPNLREALAAAGTDPELREYLADPKARAEIKQLSKKELREFLFGEVEGGNAVQTFERYSLAAGGAAAPSKQQAPSPETQRLDAMEKRFQADIDARDHAGYISNRQREYQALLTEFPELKNNQKHLQHVLEWAESRFEQAALRRGIDTDMARNPNWTAQALRAGVKPPSYREGQAFYSEVLGKPKPVAAPATSKSEPGGTPQAPRSAAEGRKRGLELMKKNGGFNNMVAAASKRGK